MSINHPVNSAARDTLYKLAVGATDAAGQQWLDRAVTDVRSAVSIVDVEATLLRVFPAALRRLGAQPMTSAAPVIETEDGTVRLRAWSPGDSGRACLLLEAQRHDDDPSLIASVYRAGDEGERKSIARALSVLAIGGKLKPLALQSGRTNNVDMFAALALDSPYPAAHYTDHEFNQLVLKALFVGLPLASMVGLAARANADLSRMCEDYVGERSAAGRAVPADIWLALAPYASASGLQLLGTYLEHNDESQRYYAALAMKNRNALS
jgi:hypothetical protein